MDEEQLRLQRRVIVALNRQLAEHSGGELLTAAYRPYDFLLGDAAEVEDDMVEDDSEDHGEELECVEEWPSGDTPRPAPCSFLTPGRAFSGTQRLSGLHRSQEDWNVTATIYSVDLSKGTIAGSLVAQNSPLSKRPVVTYFEGDIIDNVHHTFFTGRKWGACPSRDTDLRHWACCPGFSPAMRAAAAAHGGRAPQLGSCPFVFMRWKECFFLNDVPQDCQLSITGFYYLSLDRGTGAVCGYYHDERSAPMQVLQLQPVECVGAAGGAAGTGSSTATAMTAAMPPPRPPPPPGRPAWARLGAAVAAAWAAREAVGVGAGPGAGAPGRSGSERLAQAGEGPGRAEGGGSGSVLEGELGSSPPCGFAFGSYAFC